MGIVFQIIGWCGALFSLIGIVGQLPISHQTSAAVPFACFILSLILERLGRISDLLAPPTATLAEDMEFEESNLT